MADLTAIVPEIKKYVTQRKKRATKIAQATARYLLAELTDENPVDTSKALSNWQVGIGSPNAPYIPAHVEGEKGNTKNESRDAAMAIGNSIINTSTFEDVIYVSNNAPYLDLLEDGRGGNRGFIARAEQNAEDYKERITPENYGY